MRKTREIHYCASYHVVARANRGEFVLHSTEMKEMFIDILNKAKEKYDFKLKHFCLMSNHIHLLIEPGPKTSLSKLMQWILSVFAIRFNRYFGHRGHVWYDRFKSKIIRSFRQFITTFHYISQNPVKALLCSKSADYGFGGLRFILENRHRLVEPPDDLLRLCFPELSVIALARFYK